MQLHLASITSVIPFISWVTFGGYSAGTKLFINGSCFFQLGPIISNICRKKMETWNLTSLCFKTSNVSQQNDSCEIIFDFFHNASKHQLQEIVWNVPVLKCIQKVQMSWTCLIYLFPRWLGLNSRPMDLELYVLIKIHQSVIISDDFH